MNVLPGWQDARITRTKAKGTLVVERRKPTTTSNFGVGRRESHDASAFYARFTAPVVSKAKHVNRPLELDAIYHGDSRDMLQVAPDSVALVVTSPPYFAGKEYEEALGQGHVPASYAEYREMLRAVFEECVRVLEPGGRIAVNVANLGRKPYRSLAADVITILQDDLRLLLRGEVVWQKAHGAGGSCAWGSFQSAANPVLRDLTERVVIASKGRFDRAMTRRERHDGKYPSEGSIFKDEFMEATLDLWDIPAESATRVGHPAPFPVELPQRLIELYTYKGDLVLDPFMGSGTTAVAALRTDRHYVGYETDKAYLEAAEQRVDAERLRLADRTRAPRPSLPAVREEVDDDENPQARAVREGRKAEEIAKAVLEGVGFTDLKENVRVGSGVEVHLSAWDQAGRLWYFDVSGAFTSARAGLRRTDTMWKALGRAAVQKLEWKKTKVLPLILLTTDLPPRGSAGWAALQRSRGELFVDVLEMLATDAQDRLRSYAEGRTKIEPVGDLLGPAQSV